jgi:hypothetical protein
MKPRNERTPTRPPATEPAPKIRFRLRKLEERIAPARGGKGTKNCPIPSSIY